MRYFAFATDYDGTLAEDAQIDEAVLASLEQLRASGRRLILLTGRQLPDIQRLIPRLDVFDRIVAENGLVLHRPAQGETVLLAPPCPRELVIELERRGVPVSVGESIASTWEPHEGAVLEAVHALGLEYQVVFNRGAVMLLPSGHNKATGLRVALSELGLSLRNTVGVGDAENDHSFLDACEYSIAVANAVAAIRASADLVTSGVADAGVREAIGRLLADELTSRAPTPSPRHRVRIGSMANGGEACLDTDGPAVLIAGPSKCGKSSLGAGLALELVRRGYQVCVIDPEGDYEGLPAMPAVYADGVASHESVVADLLRDPERSMVVNLLGVPLSERPAYAAGVMDGLRRLRRELGRPHWILIDEAHHMLWDPLPPDASSVFDAELENVVLLTVRPSGLAREALAQVGAIVAMGDDPVTVLRDYTNAVGLETAAAPAAAGDNGGCLFWKPRSGQPPQVFWPELLLHERLRHRRKYAVGDLGPERAFQFRGSSGRGQLSAPNLAVFADLAGTLDGETWAYHLRRGDYARWFRDCIGDEPLAAEAEMLATTEGITADEARHRLRQLIEARYVLPR